MHAIETQARRADPAAIAAILTDARDEPLRNRATRIALEVLKSVPGSVHHADDDMITSLAFYGGQHHVACTTAQSTVLFMGKHAFVLSRDEGSVPWVRTERMQVPDMTFFRARVRMDDGLAERLVGYVYDLMDQAQEAVEVALENVAEDDRCYAPSH